MQTPVMQHIRRSIFRRARTVVVNQSPFNAKTNRAGFQDFRWTFQFDYAPMKRAVAAPLLAVIAAQGEGFGVLDGVYDPDRPFPLSGYAGNVVAYGAQVGSVINLACNNGSTLIFKADDLMVFEFAGVGYQMFSSLTDVVSDAGGLATVQLDAPIRGTVPGGALVRRDFGFAEGITPQFRMTGYTKETDKDGFYMLSLSGEEIV